MLSDCMDMSPSDKPVPISTDSTAENKTCRQNGFILHLNVSDPDAIWKKAIQITFAVKLQQKEQNFLKDKYTAHMPAVIHW